MSDFDAFGFHGNIPGLFMAADVKIDLLISVIGIV